MTGPRPLRSRADLPKGIAVDVMPRRCPGCRVLPCVIDGRVGYVHALTCQWRRSRTAAAWITTPEEAQP